MGWLKKAHSIAPIVGLAFAMTFAWMRLRAALKSRSACHRLVRATRARVRMISTASEIVVFGLLSLASLAAGFGIALCFALKPDAENALYAMSLALAFTWNSILFASRFLHYASTIGDIDRIPMLRRIVREGPPPGRFIAMQWKGQRPANDHF